MDFIGYLTISAIIFAIVWVLLWLVAVIADEFDEGGE